MESQNELIQMIEEQIKILDQYISNFSFEDEETVEKNKMFIEKHISSQEFSFLGNLNLNELLNILPESFNDDLMNLDFYIKSLNTTKYGANMMERPDVASHIRQILSKINTYLLELEEKNRDAKKNATSYQQKKEELCTLKNKIVEEQPMEETDVDEVFNMINMLNDKNKAIDLLIAFGEGLLKENTASLSHMEELEEYIENENQEEVQQQLILIFQKYGLNFNDLKPRDQSSLVKYGNCQNIDKILEIIRNNHIDLNEKYDNGEDTILTIKSLAITEILLYADALLMKNIFTLAKQNKVFVDDSSQKIDFMLLIKHPERFIKKKRRYYRKGEFNITNKVGKEIVIGCADDFLANFKFFTSLGISAKEFLKCKKVPEASHQQILNHQKLYEMYGIDKEHYLRAISCLYFNSQPADVIDQYIEIGCFDYFIDNMSIVNLGADSVDCYRLLYAMKYTNLDSNKFFTIRNEKKKPKLILNNSYLNSNAVISSMTNQNCYKLLNKYIPFSERHDIKELYEKFNDIIARSDNSDIQIATTRRDSIIPLLDEHLLVKNENNTPIFPNVYRFGTVPIYQANGEFLKNWNIDISRNKVVRIYNTLMEHGITDNYNVESIIYAVTRNTILTEEEYHIIYDIIMNLIEKGRTLR